MNLCRKFVPLTKTRTQICIVLLLNTIFISRVVITEYCPEQSLSVCLGLLYLPTSTTKRLPPYRTGTPKSLRFFRRLCHVSF